MLYFQFPNFLFAYNFLLEDFLPRTDERHLEMAQMAQLLTHRTLECLSLLTTARCVGLIRDEGRQIA